MEWSLSPPLRPPTVALGRNARRLGRGRIKARGERWEGERKHRSAPPPFSLSSAPASRFFLSLAFTNRSLCGGERNGATIPNNLWYTLKLNFLGGTDHGVIQSLFLRYTVKPALDAATCGR